MKETAPIDESTTFAHDCRNAIEFVMQGVPEDKRLPTRIAETYGYAIEFALCGQVAAPSSATSLAGEVKVFKAWSKLRKHLKVLWMPTRARAAMQYRLRQTTDHMCKHLSQDMSCLMDAHRRRLCVQPPPVCARQASWIPRRGMRTSSLWFMRLSMSISYSAPSHVWRQVLLLGWHRHALQVDDPDLEDEKSDCEGAAAPGTPNVAAKVSTELAESIRALLASDNNLLKKFTAFLKDNSMSARTRLWQGLTKVDFASGLNEKDDGHLSGDDLAILLGNLVPEVCSAISAGFPCNLAQLAHMCYELLSEDAALNLASIDQKFVGFTVSLAELEHMMLLRCRYFEALLGETCSFLDQGCKLAQKAAIVDTLSKITQVLPSVRSACAALEGPSLTDAAAMTMTWTKLIVTACRSLVPVFAEKKSDQQMALLKSTISTKTTRMTVAELKSALSENGVAEDEMPGKKDGLTSLYINKQTEALEMSEAMALKKYDDAVKAFASDVTADTSEASVLSNSLDEALHTMSSSEPGEFVLICTNVASFMKDYVCFLPALSGVLLMSREMCVRM
jgi:hypothetical protein